MCQECDRYGPPILSLRPCHLAVTLEFRIALRCEGACLAQNNETLEFFAGQGKIAKLDSQLMELVALLENHESRHNMLDVLRYPRLLARLFQFSNGSRAATRRTDLNPAPLTL